MALISASMWLKMSDSLVRFRLGEKKKKKKNRQGGNEVSKKICYQYSVFCIHTHTKKCSHVHTGRQMEGAKGGLEQLVLEPVVCRNCTAFKQECK